MAQDRVITRVSGVDQNGTAATVGFTSDAIPFTKNVVWSLNVWITSLAWTGTAPTVTLEVSNDTNASSFTALSTATTKTVNPSYYFDNLDSTWKYMRIVYAANGASAGTKNFDLIQFV